MNKVEIKKCVLEILDSLCNRSGFDDWWYNIGEEIEQEIETELAEIIERRLNKDRDKDRLMTKSNPEFANDLYEITKVITPSRDGKHPKVGEQHRCFVSDTVGLISTSGMYTGYYEVEGKKIRDRESWEEYILNLDTHTIISEDVPYWEKYYKEITDNGVNQNKDKDEGNLGR